MGFSAVQTGVPDRIVLLPKGITRLVELKSTTGTLSNHQKKFKKDVEAMGHKVYVLNSKKLVDEFIEEMKERLEI